MKVVNKICYVLALVFGLASLVLFFTNFATITWDGNSATLVGAQLGFGTKIDVAKGQYDLARSTDILFCFFLTVFGLASSAASIKFKGLRYAAPAFGLISGIYMLVVALSSPWKFVDTRTEPMLTANGIATDVQYYGNFVLFAAIALLLFAAAAIAYLLISDYIEVSASKNKKTIPQRIVAFFRDYKSEINKIVWPGLKEVVKNTGIVLVMCLLIGGLIWLLDLGLGNLLKLILGV